MKSVQLDNSQSASIAACGAPSCGGCYEVGDGVRIHPPRPSYRVEEVDAIRERLPGKSRMAKKKEKENVSQ
jgi:hypothetical protein